MALSSPGIAILFEHSEWFQPLFAGLDRRGIPYDRLLAAEEVELDLSPGTVPLLTREGEVAIAQRIERGQMLVLKAISRSSIVLKEMLAIGEELRKHTQSIEKIVLFDDENLTEEKIENKTKQTLKIIDKIQKLYQVALRQAAKLENTPKSKKR